MTLETYTLGYDNVELIGNVWNHLSNQFRRTIAPLKIHNVLTFCMQ